MGRVINCNPVAVPEPVTCVILMFASPLSWASSLRRYCFFAPCMQLIFSYLYGSRTFYLLSFSFVSLSLGCSFSGQSFNDHDSSRLWPFFLQYVQYFSILFTVAGFSAFSNVNLFAYQLVRQSLP